MKTKTARFLSLLFGLTILFTGCEAVAGETPESATPEPSTQTEQTSQPQSEEEATLSDETDGFTTAYNFKAEDTDTAWSESDSTIITFDGDSARISGGGATFSGSTLGIDQQGTYVLSGNLDNGQVLIEAGKSDLVRVVLNGVKIHNESGPAIYAPQSEKVVLILQSGTENAISDGGSYNMDENSDDPAAAIYVQDDLSICGDGALTVVGASKQGIRAQDDLAISGGIIRVNAVGDALRGRDGVAIQGGDLTLITQSDGIQSNNADAQSKGFVVISGGNLTIESANDGIQAESSLTITDGNLNIKTGGGSANAPVAEEDFRSGRGGGQNNTPAATEEETASMKALKAGAQLLVEGGTFTIDAEDDALHSNGVLYVAAGTFSIQTGDDGLHADAALEISGGEIDITACYEGVEGLSVTIGGGSVSVVANDDAINAAGGTNEASGPMGRDRFSSSGDIFIRVTGGDLDLYAPNDGIDSNGDVFIEGGSIKISAQSMGMEGAIDLDGSLTITGGEIITAGSILSISKNSTQPVLLVSYTGQVASGSLLEIRNARDETALSYTSKIACMLSGFSSPAFTVGETYSLYVDGEKRVDITLTDATTSIGDDGGAYDSNNKGGGTGGKGGAWQGQNDGGPNRRNPAEEPAPPEGGERPGGGN